MVSFATAASNRDQRWAVVITIEGIGAYAGQWKFCSTVPTYASGSALYKPWISSWPDILSERVEVLGGVTESGELSFELVDVDDAFTAQLRPNGNAQTQLTADVTAAATSIFVVSASGLTAGSSVIYIGNEALLVSNISGLTLTVTRGALGTEAQAHKSSDYVFTASPYIRSRRVRLYLVPEDGDSASDETELPPSYFLDTLEMTDDLNGYVVRGKSQAKYTARLASAKVNTLGIRASRGDAQYPTLDFDRVDPVTRTANSQDWSTDVWLRVNGREVITATFLSGGPNSYSARVTRRGMAGTAPDSKLEAPESIGTSCAQVYVASDESTLPGSFRFSPGPSPSTSRSSGTWTKSAHWIDIILGLLTSSAHPDDGLQLVNYKGSGTDAERSNWSSLPVGIGIGVPVALVDVAALLALRARTPEFRFPGFFIGDKPEPFAELIQRWFLRPIGAYLTTANGLITIVLPRSPLEGESTTPIGNDQILMRPVGVRRYQAELRARQDMSLLTSKVIYKARTTFGAEWNVEVNASDFAGLYGQRGYYEVEEPAIEIDAPGIVASSTGGMAWVRQLAMRRLYRFHRPAWRLTWRTDISQYATKPGDLVALSNTELPNFATGTRGWTSVTCQVVERAYHVGEDGAWIDFTAVSFGPGGRYGKISPSANVTSVSTNTATITINRYTQTDAIGGLPTTDASSFTAGEVLALKNRDGSSASGSTQTVVSTGSGTVELDGNFGGALAGGTILVYASSGSATSTQKNNFVFWADRATRAVGATAQTAWNYGEA